MAVRRRPIQGASGRHFLRSSRLAADFVREAGVAPGDLVVDIGAGAGALTRALADAGADVLALELAPDLVRELRRRFDANRSVTVIEADVLDWEWPARPFAVVANLPFAHSGAILAHMLRDPCGALRRADVIVQWDLAAKHTAVWPATLKSTYWRAWYDVTITGPPRPDGLLAAAERRCCGRSVRAPPRASRAGSRLRAVLALPLGRLSFPTPGPASSRRTPPSAPGEAPRPHPGIRARRPRPRSRRAPVGCAVRPQQPTLAEERDQERRRPPSHQGKGVLSPARNANVPRRAEGPPSQCCSKVTLADLNVPSGHHAAEFTVNCPSR